jgi:hypothetical protein
VHLGFIILFPLGKIIPICHTGVTLVGFLTVADVILAFGILQSILNIIQD